MLSFPTLKSGAVVQYPLASTLRSETQSVWFLDGSKQQYRVTRTLRRWKIALSQIDDQELGALIDFVEQQEGAPFSFTDPSTGVAAAKCVVSDEGFEAIAMDELHNDAALVIEEIA